MESFDYKDSFPTSWSSVHVALFTKVTNAGELRTRIVKASTMEGEEGDLERDMLNFAFVDAKLVTSRMHIQTAVYQSILAATHNALKTKTVHSEILWSLNANNNITEALRRFGVSDATDALLVVRVGPPSDPQDVENQMKKVVVGELTPLNSLTDVTDWVNVRKHYKLTSEPAVAALEKDSTKQKAVVNMLVTSYVAMKCVAA